MANTPVFTSSALAKPSLNHGFFGRSLGPEKGYSTGLFSHLNVTETKTDVPDRVHKNRQLIAHFLGIHSENLVFMHQTHSNRVKVVTTKTSHPIHADAIVTNQTNLCLCIQTADCVPILFYDEKSHIIAACHAGWKGNLAGIIRNTVSEMIGLGAQPDRMTTVIGPCIHQNSYQVDGHFYETHLKADRESEPFFLKHDNHWYFDLPGYCRHQLQTTGIHTIDQIPKDTYTNEDDFFSCRRAYHNHEHVFGNQASCIVML